MVQVTQLLAKYAFHVRPAVRRVVANIITWVAFQPDTWLLLPSTDSAMCRQSADGGVHYTSSVCRKNSSIGCHMQVSAVAVQVCSLEAGSSTCFSWCLERSYRELTTVQRCAGLSIDICSTSS